ncbi:MAG TPA: FtsX-like permease family protein [Candidatus Thermoplasmatota archaeon]|nr:FtsX-like permease family protein [Candidatus Thermoplasmatota archaeon]
MKGLRKLPMLGRLARRYALGHRKQTARAVLGLVVVTVVLVGGLGMGESMTASLKRATESVYGPVDIVAEGWAPAGRDAVAEALSDPALARYGFAGAPSLATRAIAAHPAAGLAEGTAMIRGAEAGEARALGPLVDREGRAVAEPRAGQVVLSETLAKRLGATHGSKLRFYAAPPGYDFEPRVDRENLTGVAGLPQSLGAQHMVEVRKDAVLLAVGVGWTGAPGTTVTISARDPSGRVHANASAASQTELVIAGDIAPGTWVITVTATNPTPYIGGRAVAYIPSDLFSRSLVLDATVSGIAEDGGRVGPPGPPVALVPLADLQAAVQSDDVVTHVLARAPVDPARAAIALETALEKKHANFRASAAKLDSLERAEMAGTGIAGFLLVMGGFTLVAGILLAFALFSALVESRRAELGIGRALGLTRGNVSLAMTLEGAIYAGAAALVGLAVGVALVAGLLAGLTAAFESEGAPRLVLSIAPTTLGLAFVVGTLIPLVTIGVASLRFARLDPARAIRGIPEDPRARRRSGLAGAIALALPGAAMALSDPWHLAGVPLLAFAAALGLSAFRLGWLGLAVALAGMAWTLQSLYSFDDWTGRGMLDPMVTMLRGAILAVGLAATAVVSRRPLESLARLVSRGKRRRASFIALRYLVAKRGSAGLTMSMIALVTLVVTVMGTLFLLFGGTIMADQGGYDIVGETMPGTLIPEANPPAAVARDVEAFVIVASHQSLTGIPIMGANDDGVNVDRFVGVTAAFAATQRFELVDRSPLYATDEAAWRAVADGRAIILHAYLPLEDFGGSRRVTLDPGGTPREVEIAGWLGETWYDGAVLVADSWVREQGFMLSTRAYVRTADGADSGTVARALTAHYAERGLVFTSLEEEGRRMAAGMQAFVLVLESFLALGLFVGLAATGFLASRAVHERGREIGTLRALGFEERDVSRAFMMESLLVALGGLLSGLVVGIVVAHSVWWREIREEAGGGPFEMPIPIIAGFAVAVLGLAALAARGPARRAAALAPAMAVRHTE